MLFRRRSTEPDDPRVAAFVDELAAAWGDTTSAPGQRPWLIWSGPLPSDGDEHDSVTAMVRERWWDFNGDGRLDEIDDRTALELLTWVFGHTLGEQHEVVPFDRARGLTTKFVSLLPERRRWFGNDWDGPPFPPERLTESEWMQTDWKDVSETLRSGMPDFPFPPEILDPEKLKEGARAGMGRDHDVFGWNSLTDHVWDTGVIAVAEGRAWMAWFTDDD